MPAQQPGYPQQNPQVQQNQSYPGYQQPYGYAQQQPGYPQQNYGQYPSGQMPQMQMPMGATPLDQGMPIEGKRSTLVRDIGIGVGIAALVLVGFLVVKMFVLDSDKGSGSSARIRFAGRGC